VESNIVHKGRHTAVCRVDITGEEEELLATGNFTMFLGKEI
jgi:acyl-coenzyme A thioesterase PaaI-like protein